MKFEISESKDFIKILTIIFGLVAIVTAGLNLFADIFIPGLAPIALGLNLFAWGLMELNIFKEKEQKFHLISGVLLIVTSILNLYVGIEQIQIMM